MTTDQTRSLLPALAALFTFVAIPIAVSGPYGLDAPSGFRLEVIILASLTGVICTVGSFRLPVSRVIALVLLLSLLYVSRVALLPDRTALIVLLVAYVCLTSTFNAASTRVLLGFLGVVAAALLPSATNVFGSPAPDSGLFADLALALVGTSFILALDIVIRQQMALSGERSRNDRLERGMENLAAVNVGFQSYSRNLEERTKLEERSRITRDVHDTIGYTLANISVTLDAALGLLYKDAGRVEKMLAGAREQLDVGHAEVRRALHTLRSLERSDGMGLLNIMRLAEQFEHATGVTVTVSLPNTRRSYGSPVDTCLYRLVQEALANAFRHGGATTVEVRIFQAERSVTATIRDNGSGSDVIEDGIGFMGMRERLSQVNGKLSWQSLPVGFALIAEIPLDSTGQPVYGELARKREYGDTNFIG